ncbi:MAG: peptidase C11 clostripain, partial [Eubacteriales bacterium]
MKRRWLCLLVALALCAFTVPARAAQAKWTVLVYLCGSDLESRTGQASDDIREMLASGAGASGAVNVLAATGGSARWQAY